MTNTATRKGKTPHQRSVDVADAVHALGAATDHAVAVMAREGADSTASREAWDAVERLGAIVHRQSRLLAGKSRGG